MADAIIIGKEFPRCEEGPMININYYRAAVVSIILTTSKLVYTIPNTSQNRGSPLLTL